MNILFLIYMDKNNPAQIWSTYTFKDLISINIYAVMIRIINNWINMFTEIYKDKKNHAQIWVNCTIKHLSSCCLYCNDTYG